MPQPRKAVLCVKLKPHKFGLIYHYYNNYTTVLFKLTNITLSFLNSSLLLTCFPQNYKWLQKLFYTNLDQINDLYNYVLKIQFKRKGCWINIKRHWPNLHLMKFGHGRPMIINAGIKKIIRYKQHLFYHSIIINFNSLHDLYKHRRYIKHVRPLNEFTLRGIRTARFSLNKRKGKISQYKHLKSKIF